MKTKTNKILAVLLSVLMIFSVLPMAAFAEEAAECEHVYTKWTVTKEPTCTETGLKEKVCIVCDQKIIEVVPANGHTEVDVPATAPTCSKKGREASVKCSVCGERLVIGDKIPALGCQDEDGDGFCDDCGVSAEDHVKPDDMLLPDLLGVLLRVLEKVFTALSGTDFGEDQAIFDKIVSIVHELGNFLDL